jgi:hypothetical protein
MVRLMVSHRMGANVRETAFVSSGRSNFGIPAPTPAQESGFAVSIMQ